MWSGFPIFVGAGFEHLNAQRLWRSLLMIFAFCRSWFKSTSKPRRRREREHRTFWSIGMPEKVTCCVCRTSLVLFVLIFPVFFFLPVSLVAVVGLEVTQTVIVLHLDKIPTAWKIWGFNFCTFLYMCTCIYSQTTTKKELLITWSFVACLKA